VCYIYRLKIFNAGNSAIPWGSLADILSKQGEKIDPGDLDTYLGALTGEGSSAIPSDQFIDAKLFATQILGFEM
jgi:hypothetical protein